MIAGYESIRNDPKEYSRPLDTTIAFLVGGSTLVDERRSENLKRWPF